MKVLVACLAVAGLLWVGFPSQASAARCVARSATGSRGWATNYSLAAAQYNALYQCAVRTPRGFTCYIVSCRW
jgi:hypothetical protein